MIDKNGKESSLGNVTMSQDMTASWSHPKLQGPDCILLSPVMAGAMECELHRQMAELESVLDSIDIAGFEERLQAQIELENALEPSILEKIHLFIKRRIHGTKI